MITLSGYYPNGKGSGKSSLLPEVIPVRLISTLERLKLLDGLERIFATPSGVALELGDGATLEWALRKWTDAADEFAIALGRAGYFIVPTMTVHLVKSRGAGHD